MSQFKRVIHLFKEFEYLLSKMTCLDEEIERKLKLRNFNNVFQITKIVEFEIHSKRKEIEIPRFVEFVIITDQRCQFGPDKPNDLDGWAGPIDDPDRPDRPMTQTCGMG